MVIVKAHSLLVVRKTSKGLMAARKANNGLDLTLSVKDHSLVVEGRFSRGTMVHGNFIVTAIGVHGPHPTAGKRGENQTGVRLDKGEDDCGA